MGNQSPGLGKSFGFILKAALMALMTGLPLLLYKNPMVLAKTISVPQDYPSIQAAIFKSGHEDVIEVSRGVYRENINFLGKAITIKSTNPEDPAVVAMTVIDGQQQGSVVTFHSGEKNDSVLNGLTLRNGRADWGGGIDCSDGSSPAITNCIIRHNWALSGGGLCCFSSSPTLTNCTIRENSAEYKGGGIYADYSSPVIAHCTISENSVEAQAGGGIACHFSPAAISNCLIMKNKAREKGGGIYCYFDPPAITNCTIVGNMSPDGGGICCAYSSPSITNGIIRNNLEHEIGGYTKPVIRYSNITGGYPGEGNSDDEPLFMNPNEGDFHLRLGSPCIDAGTNKNAPATDRDGLVRPEDRDGDGVAVCDMGAYEFHEKVTATLSGRIFDRNTGVPLPAVKIEIPGRAHTVTTRDGHYSLPDIFTGVYDISFLKEGFMPLVQKNVYFRPDGQLVIDLAMAPEGKSN
ncbi:MAG: right-handed parallel beta-helix repeat-containing protein [bacterium]